MKLIAVVLISLFGFMGVRSSPAGTCPSTNGVYVDFLTDDGDCSKFYKCDWGSPVLYNCPAGLHFNPTLNVCDWPEQAGCGSGVTNPTTTDAPSTPTTDAGTTSTDAPSSTDSAPVPSGDCNGRVSCPAVPGDFPVFHAHPDDCGRYCKCDWGGIAHDMPCPAGLHFNTKLDVCDWPSDAGCSSSGSTDSTANPNPPTDSTPTTDAGTTSNTDTPSTDSGTVPSGDCNGRVSCPAVPGDFPVFHAHPDNCGRYCKCDWGGIAHDMPCPDGLHFNTDLNVCDYPYRAGCDGGSDPVTDSTTDGTTPTDPTDPVTDSTTDGTTSTDPVTDTTTDGTTSAATDCAVSCPDVPGVYPVFHKHPTDCGRYCKCDWGGVSHDMPCPSGLHFNTDLNVCDWPANARCA